MAFEPEGLQRIGGANSDSMAVWCYSVVEEADAYAAISGADYFIDRINEMKHGDIIFVTSSDPAVTLSFVSNNGTTISIVSGNTIGNL